MPLKSINNTSLFIQDTGGEGPPILFSHGLLWSLRMYSQTVEDLKGQYRCISYDHRGQGQSAKPDASSYPIELLTDDAIALIESLGLAPIHFVGLSMGGFVGMRIAARRPDLIRSLVLISTAADEEPKANLPKYNLMNFVTRLFGVRIVSRSVMPIMFGRTFLRKPEHKENRRRWKRELIGNECSITRAVRGVFERDSVVHELANIQCPTLVLHGAEDEAISIERADALHNGITDARLSRTPVGGHSLPIEAPDFIRQELEAFFETHS